MRIRGEGILQMQTFKRLLQELKIFRSVRTVMEIIGVPTFSVNGEVNFSFVNRP